jgi:hypothetical protein
MFPIPEIFQEIAPTIPAVKIRTRTSPTGALTTRTLVIRRGLQVIAPTILAVKTGTRTSQSGAQCTLILVQETETFQKAVQTIPASLIGV